VKEIQTYIKQLFQSGQNELQTRDVDKENKENDRPGISGGESRCKVNKFKLMVLTNAVCVDILVWATKDENGM
jgi:hypothetical protein